MKGITIFIGIFAAAIAYGDCVDTWVRDSKSGLYIEYSEGCYQGKLVIVVEKSGKTIKVPFDEECPSKKNNKSGEVVEFSCRKKGKSPLAGATFKYKTKKSNHECENGGGVQLPDRFFLCTKGCGPSVPKKLIQEYSEGGC